MLKKYFVSPTEPMLYLIVAIVLVVVLNFRLIADTVLPDGSGSVDVVLTEVGHFTRGLLTFFDSYSITNLVLTFFAWFIFAQVAFSVVANAIRFSKGAVDVVRESGSGYVHPQDYSRWHYWKNEFSKIAIRTSVYVLGGAILLFSLVIAIPLSSILIGIGASSGAASWQFLFYGAASVVTLFAMNALWAYWVRLVRKAA